MKLEYSKIIEEDPILKARLLISKTGENEYEIVEFDIPKEYRNNVIGIEDELLREVTKDADNEGVTLHVDINKILKSMK